MPRSLLAAVAAALLLCATACRTAAVSSTPAARSPTLAELDRDAAAARKVVTAPLALRFAEAVDQLGPVSPRVVFKDKVARQAFTPEQAERLPAEQRSRLERLELDEAYFYTTRYGSPVSYAMPLQRLAEAGFGERLAGKRILDYGYGYLGHLKMLASLGADVTGVDADPILPILYGQSGDTGAVKGRGGPGGTVRVLSGRFPEEPAVTEAIGGGYDLFLSKNTLKRGYVHPSQPTDPNRTLQLKVTDEEYVRAVWELLRPGGFVLLYNLYPAQKPEFIPWAEGETPFPREVWERAGFKVEVFDCDDTAFARTFAKALRWDQGPDAMDLEKDLFAVYLVARKPE
ncbi:MAG: hypothetical protein QM765_32660 [Myxococcales bacterium]